MKKEENKELLCTKIAAHFCTLRRKKKRGKIWLENTVQIIYDYCRKISAIIAQEMMNDPFTSWFIQAGPSNPADKNTLAPQGVFVLSGRQQEKTG